MLSMLAVIVQGRLQTSCKVACNHVASMHTLPHHHSDGAEDGVERLLDGRKAAAMNAAEAARQFEVGTEAWGEMPIEAKK